ncbi:MAG: DUF2851 family protein [Dehalococcoidales bacterium]|nr:DUF2851 family protein [Dehalococcoidales bacterium]
MPVNITEKAVVGMWQDYLQSRMDLKTVDNLPVSVIYPGRRNDDRGADFKDAIINTGRGPARGDIEVHVKTSDWRTHRHHLDPHYNRVILHVVYQHDTNKAIALENGGVIPTLALGDNTLEKNFRHEASLPCHNIGNSHKVQAVADRLDAAGEARFITQAENYKKSIEELGAGQTLYREIMTALGYSKNKQAMARLSDLMPLVKLEGLASGLKTDDEYLARCQAHLLGAAGLLPSQRPGRCLISDDSKGWKEKLEDIWGVGNQGEGMSMSDWHFFKVRPGNSPVRRITAMSYLLLRYRRGGLLEGLKEKFKEMAGGGEAKALEEGLMIPAEGFWKNYLDFGLPARGIAPALLGKGRAADIIVNAALPFFYASESETVLEIYRSYHALEENTLVKHMRGQLGITRSLVSTARRQQGLIHIYKTYCLDGNCEGCPLADV